MAQLVDEPGTCWHSARHMQPEFGFKGMRHVTRGDVGHEDV